MQGELLFEIGLEEMPYDFLAGITTTLAARFREAMAGCHVPLERVEAFATPRRLLLVAEGMAPRAADRRIEKFGPARRIAFDEQGAPTKAALGFARSQGVAVEELQIRDTPRGECLYVERLERGAPTPQIVAEELPRLLLSLPIPKAMRWGDLDIRFVRPVHWILCLFEGKVVPFTFAGIESGNETFGHRFSRVKRMAVSGFSDYREKVARASVVLDAAERKRIIEERISALAAEAGGDVVEDPPLLDEVCYLTEYPSAVLGHFDPKFLELPREVLISSMRSHQRYFSVEHRETGALLPCFITVNNTLAQDLSIVRKGNERVLAARLTDAAFFFKQDVRTPLEERVHSLERVVFQAQLGTLFDKVQRIQKLALRITERVAEERNEVDEAFKSRVLRAAWLSKADLRTEMVGEFPNLQGFMGSVYARHDGEDPRVAQAIREHYLPVQAYGPIPASLEGAILALADKGDTLAGIFGIGEEPTGTRDPFGLRRAAIGMIRILLESRLHVPLETIVADALDLLSDRITRPVAETKRALLHFLEERLRNHLVEREGHPSDVVAAALAVSWGNLPDTQERIAALERFKGAPDFQALVVAVKRTLGILGDFHPEEGVDPERFEDDAERRLFDAVRETEAQITSLSPEAALERLARLKTPIDDFFDAVMVNVEDERIRHNRLTLLARVASVLCSVADISKIMVT